MVGTLSIIINFQHYTFYFISFYIINFQSLMLISEAQFGHNLRRSGWVITTLPDIYDLHVLLTYCRSHDMTLREFKKYCWIANLFHCAKNNSFPKSLFLLRLHDYQSIWRYGMTLQTEWIANLILNMYYKKLTLHFVLYFREDDEGNNSIQGVVTWEDIG